MQFRLKAFGLHLLGSACVLTLVLGGMYLGWYRWPGWYLSSVLHIVGIVLMVDLAVGPTLTLVVANPGKPRKSLARDIGIIVAVQLVALGYGTVTLWMGRPLYYAFSADCLQLVQASDLQSDEIALGQRQNPQLAPHWYSLPRWIWAPLPEDPQQRMKIVRGDAVRWPGCDPDAAAFQAVGSGSAGPAQAAHNGRADEVLLAAGEAATRGAACSGSGSRMISPTRWSSGEQAAGCSRSSIRRRCASGL